MAVNPQASLVQIRAKVGQQRLQVSAGVQAKFRSEGIGDVVIGGGTVRRPVSPLGFAPVVAAPFIPPSFPSPIPAPVPSFPGPTQPTGAFNPFVGTTPAVPPGELGCNLLPEGFARTACLAALGLFGGTGQTTGLVPDCPVGMVKVGNTCVDLTALPPGGDPAFTPAGGGVATVGAFGLPALSPQGVSRVVRKCGRGMVLGIDNLCYPKAVLTGRSKFRKWRRPVRPPISRRDVVAIRRAAGARDRVKELAKDVGLKLGTTTRKKPTAAQVHHSK